MVSGEYKSADEPTRKDRRERYEKVLRIVEYNTGDGGPPLAGIEQVTLIASYSGIGPADTRKAIQAAVSNGHLLRARGRVALTNEDSIRTVRDAERNRDAPNQRLLDWCTDRLSGGDA